MANIGQRWAINPRTPALIKRPKNFPQGWENLGDFSDSRGIPDWVVYIYEHSKANPRAATSPHGAGYLEYLRGKYFEYVIQDNTDVYRRRRQ